MLMELHHYHVLISFMDVPTCLPDLIDIMVKAGAKGIVIAGVGDGNMNAGTLEAAKKQLKQEFGL